MSEIELNCSSSSKSSADNKRAAQLAKLRELSQRKHTARKQNLVEVEEEARRNKLPSNYEQRAKRLMYQEEEERFVDECRSSGKDAGRIRVLDVQADVAEKLEIRQRKKRNPDQGFADYEQASFRKYQRLVRQLKPNMQVYAEKKNVLGSAMYPTADTLPLGQIKDSKVAIDRMANDIEEQVAKRKTFSRRRAFDAEADIDYINDSNMRFNQKLERFYGQYTSEIKQNLERGTAV